MENGHARYVDTRQNQVMKGICTACMTGCHALALALAKETLAVCVGAWAAENSPNTEGWAATCPTGFAPQVGLNSGFFSDGAPRQFHVLLPDDLSTPRPVFVALTETVQRQTVPARAARIRWGHIPSHIHALKPAILAAPAFGPLVAR